MKSSKLIRSINYSLNLEKPSISIDPIALFDILLIVLMLVSMGSHFLFAPGMAINLSERNLDGIVLNAPNLPDLPSGTDPYATAVDNSLCILNLMNDDLFIYEGNIFNRRQFEIFLSTQKNDSKVLLVKMDKNTSGGLLIEICALAKKSGYSKIQIATSFK